MKLAAGAVLLVLAVGAQSLAQETLDYRKITVKQRVGEAVRGLAGDDIEVRRTAGDDLKMIADERLSKLGLDPEAEKVFRLFGDGVTELFWFGKATSRVRAERIMEEEIDSVAILLKSPDQPRAEACRRVLERFASVLARNPDHPSSAKLTDEIKKAFADAGLELSVKPATEVASFLDGDKNSEALEEAPPSAPVAAEPKPVEPPPLPAAPPAPKPLALPTVTVTAPAASRARQAAAPAPVSAPRVVSQANPKADDPAYKVTTFTAPQKSRASATIDPPASAPVVRSAPVADGSDGSSVLNILLEQFKSKDGRRLEAALRLTLKTADVVLSALEKGNDERAARILANVRELTRSEDLALRRTAVIATTALKDKLSIKRLIELLEDQDETVSSYALSGLHELTGKDFGRSAKAWSEWASTTGVR